MGVEFKTRARAEDSRYTDADVPCAIVTADDGSGQYVVVPLETYKSDPTTYTSQFVSPADARATKLAAIAAERRAHSQRFIYDGVETACDVDARAAINGVVNGLQLAGSQGPIPWKLADGEFREWMLPDLITFGLAMMAHVQACFRNEATLTAQAEAALTSADVARVDISAGWPAGAIKVTP